MWRGYEFIAKGYGGKRANKLANSVPEGEWQEGPTNSQLLGVPSTPHRYARKSKSVVRRWVDEKGKPHQDYLVCSLFWLGAPQIATLYDARGGMEVDIKGDKRGLGIEKRRKKSFLAQEALVLLAQLSNNLLMYFKRWFLEGSAAAGEGGIGDDGRGKGWKDKREGALEVTAPSSVGEGRCNGHRDTLPSEWMAYLLAPKLGVNLTRRTRRTEQGAPYLCD